MWCLVLYTNNQFVVFSDSAWLTVWLFKLCDSVTTRLPVSFQCDVTVMIMMREHFQQSKKSILLLLLTKYYQDYYYYGSVMFVSCNTLMHTSIIILFCSKRVILPVSSSCLVTIQTCQDQEYFICYRFVFEYFFL